MNALAGSSMGYLVLTHAAAAMLEVAGSDELKQHFLKPMVEGRWFGTMMLSEPQAGSSLGDIRTRAVLQADGHYHLSGSKMWISGGDHDLAENIVHMVLAKISDADGVQPGSQGISLFVVPKYLLNPDGSLGPKNGVSVSGINHKMGQRAIVNTVPILGGDRPCVGYLLGEPGRGLATMFHMMNEARIAIGTGAAECAYAGYKYALAYAKERPQGRSLRDPDPSKPPVSIIQHPDVRRMLLEQKALSEGAMALSLFAAELVDRKASEEAQEQQRVSQLLDVLTPIAKTWPSMWGLHANYLAIQVLGGYGYTDDYPLQRLYRDNRLNEIHEGTTGIQGLDLLGRKVLPAASNGMAVLIREMQISCEQAEQHPQLQDLSSLMREAVQRLHTITQSLRDAATQGQTEVCLANATVYLDFCGHIVVAWQWLKMATAAQIAMQDAASAMLDFYRGKLRAARYYFTWHLPRTVAQAELLKRLDSLCLDSVEQEF